MSKKAPADTAKAFAFLVSKCASGALKEMIEAGLTDKQARNRIILYFLDFASGEACRVARNEGREPNREKWLKAVNDAFDAAVSRTEPTGRLSPRMTNPAQTQREPLPEGNA